MMYNIFLGIIIYFIIGLGVTLSTLKDTIIEDWKVGEYWPTITATIVTAILWLPFMVHNIYKELKEKK